MPQQTTDRRQLLRLAAATASTLWLPRSAWSLGRLKQDPFALGVASGAPTPDGVVLWTRLHFDLPQRDAFTLRWEVAHDEGFTRIVRSGQVQAEPALGHAVHAEVAGLEPDRWYFYRFMLGEAVSPVGRTRTFPRPEAQPARLRLGYASCQRWEHGYYAAWRHMRAEQLDAVMFLGDYIYEYPGATNAVRAATGGWVLTLDDYRRRYALHRSDADLQAMHAACPWLLTWDDHEVQNDYAGLHEGTGVPLVGTVDDFGARRAAAYQAWYEHMPVRASMLTHGLAGLARGAEMRIYQQVPFGRLATLHLLDSRQYRDRQPCLKDGQPGGRLVDPAQCTEWAEPQRNYLGRTQEQWLDGALARSTGRWNVIGQQTLFGPRDAQPGAGQRLWNDGWDGYAGARRRVTDALQRHAVSNPVLLGGDVHENWVGHVKADYADAGSATVGVEFCGTSISSRASASAVEKTPERLAENPHFVFGDAQYRGYGVAEFTPGGLSTTLRAVQDATRPDSAAFTLAAFGVRDGRARIERT
ncbi:MAG: alkaline phosphatase D family protein [Hylemonella sp.]|nr:alkaline phosphatase D family protein [Hylemonella sp.]